MLVKFNYLSKALMQQTNVTMILPSWTLFDEARGKSESYQKGAKFQVLYLFHGGTGDDSDYVNFSNIVRYADEHKLAVVMPAGYNSSYINDADDVLPWPARYWDYIFEELPEVCASMFPISTRKEDTFVGGLSMGSMAATKWAIYGAHKCEAALIMSGGGMDTTNIMAVVEQSADEHSMTDFSVDVDKMKAQGIQFADPSDPMFIRAKERVKEGIKTPKLFMTCGGDDFIRVFAKASRDLLSEIGYDVFYEEVPGYAHEWDFWDLSLKKAIESWLPIKHDVILDDNK